MECADNHPLWNAQLAWMRTGTLPQIDHCVSTPTPGPAAAALDFLSSEAEPKVAQQAACIRNVALPIQACERTPKRGAVAADQRLADLALDFGERLQRAEITAAQDQSVGVRRPRA